MAIIDSIYLHKPHEDKAFTVRFRMEGIGEHKLDVPLPDKFLRALIVLAQNAADRHELQAKALLLAEDKPNE